MVNIRRTEKKRVEDFDYERLTDDRTQQFIGAIVEMWDRALGTGTAFQDFAREERALAQRAPAELFKRFTEGALEATLTTKQRQFVEYASVNCDTIFRWFERNRGGVNVSPRQREWFTRWFEKTGVEFRFDRRQEKTNFERLFEIEHTREGEA